MLDIMSKKSAGLNKEHLREVIHQTLCDIGQLESSQFPLNERPLTRGGDPCGVLFSVNGPRQVTLTLITLASRITMKNKLFLYDSSGSRCDQVLVEHLKTVLA